MRLSLTKRDRCVIIRLACFIQNKPALRNHKLITLKNVIVSRFRYQLTFSGLSLLIMVVFPLLSSPIQRTLISFFFMPNQLDSLSKNPMIWEPLKIQQNSILMFNSKIVCGYEPLVTTRSLSLTAREWDLGSRSRRWILTSYEKWRSGNVDLDVIWASFRSRFVASLQLLPRQLVSVCYL